MRDNCGMKIELIDIKELKTDPRNVRLHDDENLGAIKKSLLQFNQQKPLVVGKGNIVVAGNATLEAAKALGWRKIAIVRTTLAGKQAMAYAIADNKTALLATWDDEALADQLKELQQLSITDFESTGFDQSSLDGLLASIQEDQAPIEDKAPEPPKKAKSKLGDLYLLGEHRLLCGDATKKEDVERLMDGQKADMVFTNPPYAVNYGKDQDVLNKKSKGKYRKTCRPIVGDNLTTEQCAEQLWRPAFKNLYESAADHCSFYMTMCQGGDQMMMMMMMMMSEHWQIKHELIWVKNAAVFSMGRLDYDYRHEPILFGWKKKHIFYGQGEFKNSFGGSGSTLIACEQLNRKCYMMEIDPRYCDVIVERWEKFTGGKAKLEKATKCPKTTKT
jgi:DNA modification methylase